ncbi:MAG: hypothetical protein Q7S21_02130 [archaeon]|nr:hypothetical protein [archaeon]
MAGHPPVRRPAKAPQMRLSGIGATPTHGNPSTIRLKAELIEKQKRAQAARAAKKSPAKSGTRKTKARSKQTQKPKPKGVSPERIKLSGRPLEIETGRRINVTRNDTLRFKQGKTRVVGLKKKVQ